ncbi:DUF3524 domain-containing protein [Candidatus Sumerlaeota bacterium]|nr:DUF3524 domain-containing protein [Candidatus Sumerlaeota bacterium]
MDILFLEAYHGGSHRVLAEGWAERSRHAIRVLTLPARKWKWRMQTAAWVFAEQAIREKILRPDLIVASDMVNLAEFLGLMRRRMGDVPAILYFHENQYSYPPQVEGKSEFQWGAINSSSALVADALIFNSEFHRRDFFDCWRRGNRIMPDERLTSERFAEVEERSTVVPVGVDLDGLDREAPSDAPERDFAAQPPLILWNHRWEHDKGPEAFFDSLAAIRAEGRRFRLAVCGETFPSSPVCFDAARRTFADQIVSFGFLESRADYARLLWQSDVVVSTSRQEFLGLSVIEALWCGCYPLLPRRLNYPHLLPEDQHAAHLYRSDTELAVRLAAILAEPAQHLPYPARQEFLRPYAWPNVVERLDALAETCADRKA